MVKKSIKIAIIQESPVYFNLEESIIKASHLTIEAAKQGADLVVFGESWFTGYPGWLDTCPEAAYWDHPPVKKIFTRMYKNSLDLSGSHFQEICNLAKDHQVIICTGLNEIVMEGSGQGTIYNSLVIINKDGQLIGHHRKLMPTFTEKLVYGLGKGDDLMSANTEFGKIGGLICWEHWMPLARQAMHNSGELIHVALWPSVHEMHQIASRHYAFEGRCFVIAVGQITYAEDIPKELILPDRLIGKDKEMIQNGGSCVIGPDGKYILAPQHNTSGIIIVDIDDLDLAIGERMNLDTSGHYQRDDVFEFNVKK